MAVGVGVGGSSDNTGVGVASSAMPWGDESLVGVDVGADAETPAAPVGSPWSTTVAAGEHATTPTTAIMLSEDSLRTYIPATATPLKRGFDLTRVYTGRNLGFAPNRLIDSPQPSGSHSS